MKEKILISIFLLAVLFTFGLVGYLLGIATTEESPEQKANLNIPKPKPVQSEVSGNIADFTPIELPDLKGKIRRLNDWKGKLIVLNFWASWCPPCRIEMPDFIEYQAKWGHAGVQFIGIGLDDEVALEAMHDELDLNYPTLVTDVQSGSKLMRDWGNKEQAMPFTLLIDRNGDVIFRRVGLMTKRMLDKHLLPLILKPN